MSKAMEQIKMVCFAADLAQTGTKKYRHGTWQYRVCASVYNIILSAIDIDEAYDRLINLQSDHVALFKDVINEIEGADNVSTDA